MTLTHKRKEEIAFNDQVRAIVLQIKQIKNLHNYEIAEILGVKYETLSRGKSQQILNSSKLLLENLQLKQRLERLSQAQALILNEVNSSQTTPMQEVPQAKYTIPRARSPRRTKTNP